MWHYKYDFKIAGVLTAIAMGLTVGMWSNHVNADVTIIHSDIHAIYKRLYNSDPSLKKYKINFRVVNDKDPQAYVIENGVNGANLYFNTGLLKVMKNRDEVAQSIAHELSHVKLNHIYGWTSEGKAFLRGIKAGELQADIYGIRMMKGAGYNCHNAIGAFRNILSIFGDYGDNEHPMMSLRVKAMERECNNG